jgi:hypothetical protein
VPITIEVDAVDAAGNRSMKVSLGATPINDVTPPLTPVVKVTALGSGQVGQWRLAEQGGEAAGERRPRQPGSAASVATVHARAGSPCMARRAAVVAGSLSAAAQPVARPSDGCSSSQARRMCSSSVSSNAGTMASVPRRGR